MSVGPVYFSKGLVINYGDGGYKTGGGHVKLYPCERGGGGAGKVLAMLKGGGGKFWGSFFCGSLKF